MKIHFCIGLLVVLSVLTGCRDKKETVIRDRSRELSADFGKHFTMITNANTEARAFSDRIMQELLSVADPGLRKRLFDRWRQVALKLDYRALSFPDNDPRWSRTSSMMDDLFSQVFPRAAESEEEKWHIKLEYLGWLRARAMAVATKRPYPKGVFATKDNRLAKVHGYNKVLWEYDRWLRRYNGYSFKYEWELVGLESWFQQGKSRMAPETAKRIADEIEGFLGRKSEPENNVKPTSTASGVSSFRSTFPRQKVLWTNGQESLGNEVVRYTTGSVYLNGAFRQ